MNHARHRLDALNAAKMNKLFGGAQPIPHPSKLNAECIGSGSAKMARRRERPVAAAVVAQTTLDAAAAEGSGGAGPADAAAAGGTAMATVVTGFVAGAVTGAGAAGTGVAGAAGAAGAAGVAGVAGAGVVGGAAGRARGGAAGGAGGASWMLVTDERFVDPSLFEIVDCKIGVDDTQHFSFKEEDPPPW